ncbi:MAG: hypothetical protein LC739_14455 [Actinobacteria bacterium]|nr:hypothetical protein [Actinomycetota bacterium]
MNIKFVRFGEIKIDGDNFDHDLILENGKPRRRDKGPSKRYRHSTGHTPLSTDEDIPWSAPKLVIGTGADGRLPVMESVREEAAARGVELIELPTDEACQLLRSAKKGSANAILHVTC